MNMGEIIKTHRLQLGMSQQELGDRLGVNKAAVQKWESGAVENIKRSKIKTLSVLFGISPTELLGWGDEWSEQNLQTNLSHNSISDNRGVIGNVSGAVTIKNGHERALTAQEQDMIRIYNSVDGKTQTQIMMYMYEIENKSNTKEEN